MQPNIRWLPSASVTSTHLVVPGEGQGLGRPLVAPPPGHQVYGRLLGAPAVSPAGPGGSPTLWLQVTPSTLLTLLATWGEEIWEREMLKCKASCNHFRVRVWRLDALLESTASLTMSVYVFPIVNINQVLPTRYQTHED